MFMGPLSFWDCRLISFNSTYHLIFLKLGGLLTKLSSCFINLVGLQIHAAINCGNSGGFVFNDKGTCFGYCFSVP